MSENAAPSTAAIQSMLKTTTEMGDINPFIMSPRRVLHPLNNPGINHQPTSEFSASHCLRDYRGPTRWTPARQPSGPRYSAPCPQGRPLRGPSMTSFQGPVRHTLRSGVHGPPPGYVAATAAAMQGLTLHPSGTFGNPPTLNRVVRPSSPFHQPTAIRPINYRAFSPAYSDFGSHGRQARSFLEPSASSRTTASSPSPSGYGQHGTYHQRDGRMPGSYPESTESARQSSRVLRRQPSQLSSNRTPSSNFEQESPLSLPPAVHLGGEVARNGEPTIPLFYDYTEAFGDEDYSSKASTRSFSSYATREGAGEGRGLMPRPQMPVIPPKHPSRAPQGMLMSRSRMTADEYAGYRSSSSDRAEMTMRDGQSEYDTPPQQTSSRRSRSSPREGDEHGPPVPAHQTSMGLSPDASLQKSNSYFNSSSSQSANESGESSPNWLVIQQSENGGDDEQLVPSSDSSASVQIKIESVEADTTDDSSAELVWRRTVLNAEQHAGLLVELNASGLSARNYRRTISPEGGRRMAESTKIEVDGKMTQSNLQGGTTTTAMDTHISVRREPIFKEEFTPERTTLLPDGHDSPILLSRASFPWLVGGPGTLDGASSEDMTARLRQSQSSLLGRSLLADPSLPGPEASLIPGCPGKILGSPLSPPQKFKLKMQHAKLAPSTSTLHLRPWNLDENYPWTSTGPDVQVDASFVATPALPEQAKPRKFKLKKIFRPSMSSRTSFQVGDSSGAAAPTASGRLSGTGTSLTNEEGRHRRSKQFGRFSLQRSSSGDGDGTGNLVTTKPTEPMSSATGAPKIAESVQPTSNTGISNNGPHHQQQPFFLGYQEEPPEMRSVFSDDSSDDGIEHRRSSIRHRISSFRARFGSPPALRSMDGSPSSGGETKRANGNGNVNKQSCSEGPRASAGTCTGEHRPSTSSSSSGAFSGFRTKLKTWKFLDRFRKWMAKRKEQVVKMRRKSIIARNSTEGQ
ncbi:MAG: hypothetical protein M1823_000378 [Watsoniomyces obsoletus]|nr:MAG: hypothetical protein M1823_000378 [Watsoniomyces obsoletus]